MHATHTDVHSDLSDLLAVAESRAARVWRHKADLDRADGNYRESTRAFLQAQTDGLWKAYQALSERIRQALAETPSWTDDDAARLLNAKRDASDLLRTLQSNLAFVLSAGDWQSPSFLHSGIPEAGTQTGRITGTVNDYKRDGHLDAGAYERAFRREYLGGKILFPPETYVFSSGMAAFATLVFHLQYDRGVRGPILAGSSIYFENKIVLEKAFPGQVRYADESDADALSEMARTLRPQAVFLDSFCNTDTLALPDLAVIVPRLLRVLSRKATLVIDNSGMAVACRPMDWIPSVGVHARVWVYESLNKFHQLGFDRVTGGILWTPSGLVPTALNRARVHLGTVMPDASVLALPEPSMPRLRRRMERIGRNAQRLAETIDAHLASRPHGAVARVIYPGLPSHASAGWASSRWFHGGFLVLAFKPGRQDISTYKKFVATAISEARKSGVDLISGTSFGFDVTRLYLTAVHATRVTKPFMRVSPGTETSEEIDAIARVLISAIESL